MCVVSMQLTWYRKRVQQCMARELRGSCTATERSGYGAALSYTCCVEGEADPSGSSHLEMMFPVGLLVCASECDCAWLHDETVETMGTTAQSGSGERRARVCTGMQIWY